MMKPLLYSIIIILSTANSMTGQSQKDIKQFNATLELEVKALLGEGAIWNYKTETLYWVDIEGKSLHIYNPKTKLNRSLPTPSAIGTVVPSEEKNKAVVALQDGIYTMDIETGTLKLVSNVEQDITANRFNDGKCDPSGRFWVGSMAFSQNEHEANLYMIDEKGHAVLKKDSVTISNGIVWTKDKKTMYYIDTPTAEIKAYDYNDANGAIANERVVVSVDAALGSPDGMAIDSNDHLWVGMWNGDAVIQFDPKTGKVLSKVAVPAHNVTSCAFGGKDLKTLYITTSSLDMTEEEHEKYPKAGSLFKLNLDISGVKSNFYKAK